MSDRMNPSGYADVYDSREKLEADVLGHVEDIRSKNGFTGVCTDYGTVIGWLNRQAAITEREVVRQREEQCAQLVCDMNATRAERDKWVSSAEVGFERIKELEAERDEWKTKCETREVAYKQADAERKRYSEQIDELTAERDDLRRRVADLTRQLDNLTHDLEDVSLTHVALPLDADYVPIHLGDTLKFMDGGIVEEVGVVTCIYLDSGTGSVLVSFGQGHDVMVSPRECHHAKRNMTDLEKTLSDLCTEWYDDNSDSIDIYEKYAGKIRELLGVEA